MSNVEAFTINEFCLAHRISRSHFYNLRRTGRGPREMTIGNMTRISVEAAAEWRRQHERPSHPAPEAA